MAKKELTIAQKKNRYRTLQYLTVAGEYVSIATPFAIMAAVNKDEWFFNDNGWRTGIGFSLACLLLAIIVTSITFESEKLNNRKGKYIKLLIGCVISAFVFMLLRDILDEIAHILWFASLGIAGALLNDPQLLILDEPTRNLSPLSNPMIREVLKNFGGVIISVSHDRKYIAEVCEKVFEMDENGLKRVYPEF